MSDPAAAPERALFSLAAQLREADTVISGLVADPADAPALGMLVAKGSRASSSPAGYAVVVEAVREGYLLHYGESRVVKGAESDLALLAGDYLYAIGLERLAGLGDQAAIRELSDLISLSAQLHADGAPDLELAAWLWVAAVCAIAAGSSEAFDAAKQGLRAGERTDSAAIRRCAIDLAAPAGLGDSVGEAFEAIHFPG